MVAYNFQARFARDVEAGRKRQTMRALGRRRHAEPGDVLQLYTGQRTKQCRLLGTATCRSITPIRMKWLIGSQTKEFRVILGDLALTPEQKAQLAKRDGFASWAEFVEFFGKESSFEGVLIKW